MGGGAKAMSLGAIAIGLVRNNEVHLHRLLGRIS